MRAKTNRRPTDLSSVSRDCSPSATQLPPPCSSLSNTVPSEQSSSRASLNPSQNLLGGSGSQLGWTQANSAVNTTLILSAALIPLLMTTHFPERPHLRGFKILWVRFLLSSLFSRLERAVGGWEQGGNRSASSYHFPAKYCIWIQLSYFVFTSFTMPEQATQSWDLLLFKSMTAFVSSYFCLIRKTCQSLWRRILLQRMWSASSVLKCSFCH